MALAFAAIPSRITSIDLSGNCLELGGSIEEVGKLLLSTEKVIKLGDSEFECQLSSYLNTRQMAEVNNIENIGTQLSTHGIFSTSRQSQNQSNNNSILDIVAAYINPGI